MTALLAEQLNKYSLNMSDELLAGLTEHTHQFTCAYILQRNVPYCNFVGWHVGVSTLPELLEAKIKDLVVICVRNLSLGDRHIYYTVPTGTFITADISETNLTKVNAVIIEKEVANFFGSLQRQSELSASKSVSE